MRFRSIAGGLAAVMAATLGVPAAAAPPPAPFPGCPTGRIPDMRHPRPARPRRPLDSLEALPDETVARRAGQGLRVRRERHHRPRPRAVPDAVELPGRQAQAPGVPPGRCS